MYEYIKMSQFAGAIAYTALGLGIFWGAFLVVDKLTPYKLWQEIVEKQNVALAILVSAVSLGISLIIAAAIHG